MKNTYLHNGIIRERKKLTPPYAEIMEIQGEISLIVKNIREEHELSQRQLAKLTGLSSRTLWKLENGGEVKLESLLRVLYVLDNQVVIDEML
ncbi:helix-turn-helix domain-containing protein [Candidatus Dojkabacteria bacterium]|nr:helix-turn-helix domain-containing protein [Candidatus Dojkabacteria bacterium]